MPLPLAPFLSQEIVSDSTRTLTGALATIGGAHITLTSIASVAAAILVALVASNLLRRAMSRIYTRRGIDVGIQYALNRLLHYGVLATGAFLALENLGISLTALAGLGAILAVGLGFGLQNITQNFVSGLILLLERPIKKGDFIEVGTTRGTVREIHARATVVTTIDNVDILVPNGKFISEPVVNQTLDNRIVRAHIDVGVAYGSDLDLVQRTLRSVADAHPAVLRSPAPKVLFTAFGDSALEFSLLIWLYDPLNLPEVSSDLRFAIDAAFRQAGLQIPFPQRDLHIHGPLAPHTS